MIDDHFLVVEIAQGWVDGLDPQGWLPNPAHPEAMPPGFSFLYPGFHFFLFKLLQGIGITHPETKMLFVRVLHAFYSLLVIYFPFKMAEKLAGQSCAKWVGWAMALFWFFPFLSVRNLVEMACLPPLLYSTWLVISSGRKNTFQALIWAGLVGGIAFSIRFQTALFLGGMGLVFLFQNRWKAGFGFGFGVLLSILLIQGGIDYWVWKRPFIQLQGYVLYNQANAFNYINGPWYNFLLVVPGALIPPAGIALFLFWFGNWRKHPFLFWPGFLFLLFHSAFPNKQERFIFPLLPFVILGGIIALFDHFSNKTKIQTGWKWGFWLSAGINFCFLFLITPASTRIAPVNAMVYLSQFPENKCFVLESTNSDDEVLLPKFYTRNWTRHVVLDPHFGPQALKNQVAFLQDCPFRFVLFRSDENLPERVKNFEKEFGKLIFKKEIDSSYFDWFLFWLNPKGNKIKNFYIFERINIYP